MRICVLMVPLALVLSLGFGCQKSEPNLAKVAEYKQDGPPEGKAAAQDKLADDPESSCLQRATLPRTAATPVQLANELVRQCPQSSLAHAIRGQALLRENRPNDAQASFARALEIDREWDDATRERARVLSLALKPGDNGEAATAARAMTSPLPAAPQEVGAVSIALGSTPGTPSQEAAAISVARPSSSAESAAAFVPYGVDPRAWSLLEDFWGFSGALGSYLNTFQGGGGLDGTMWIPELNCGGGGFPTPSPGGPGSQPFQPFAVGTGEKTVGEEEAECLQRAQRACRNGGDSVDQEYGECVETCSTQFEAQDPRHEECCTKCDDDFFNGKNRAEQDCNKLKNDCRPLVASQGVPTITGAQKARLESAPQDVCGRFKDPSVCKMVVGCGWCSDGNSCLSGMITGAASGNCKRQAWDYGKR